MKYIATLIALAVLGAAATYGDTFGSGPQTFTIDFVTVGDPGNPADLTGSPTPAGSVSYAYRIGKYEISRDMVDKANELGGLGITRDIRSAHRPVTSVSWIEAARFVNWLNTSKGKPVAYKFDTSNNFQLWEPTDLGYNPANPFRNSRAHYFLPNTDEWYKAAYYDPDAGVYYDYPTGSNTEPDGTQTDFDPIFDAVFNDGAINILLNEIDNVGTSSPYGTFGQGGSVWEWEETELDLVNDNPAGSRALRGGSSISFANALHKLSRAGGGLPHFESIDVGFRVASVIPEPSALALIACAAGILLARSRH